MLLKITWRPFRKRQGSLHVIHMPKININFLGTVKYLFFLGTNKYYSDSLNTKVQFCTKLDISEMFIFCPKQLNSDAADFEVRTDF